VTGWPCCIHCGCPLRVRFGHDSPCISGCDHKTCEDCGGQGMSWEDGLILCNDCAILRAKRSQMIREGNL